MLEDDKETQKSIRAQFDIIEEPKIDLKSYTIKGDSKFPPIYNLLIIGSCIALFVYVNSYYVGKVVSVLNGTVTSIPTETWNCESYYCDKSAYNYINYNTFYEKCNTLNCNITCSNYTCSDSSQYNANYFYGCHEARCSSSPEIIPDSIHVSYVLTILAVGVFVFAAAFAIVYGIIMCVMHRGLSGLERAGLLVSFFWPMMKYYAFRQREEWEGFKLDLKLTVIIDILVIIPYVITSIIYCILFSYSFWQTAAELCCFYAVVWATIFRIAMVYEVAKPFFAAERLLREAREEKYNE